ncbi:SRPBCC family protein [Hazenella sp. IB182357]|uniref:SRPBCC family protein n=1 Tax=Polycladospora coralii TaxID=2771432 RepID=A0A926RT41_9BACL|nr:SRPBCC family protein [Polycladospora coralii]MBD1372330.1 SRPBCC family protein [Polycladospora coralii]MBS7531480.1 SRPBCC family protein [Polycladospora coralii]
MPIIRIEENIHASIQICFDLSRNIDLHMQSTAHTKEKAVSGVTSGLINLNETVTWEAVHLGVPFSLTSKITQFVYPYYFVDEMVEGPFKRFKHEHFFVDCQSATKVIDIFDYNSPMGILGDIFDHVYLANYMRQFLSTRLLYLKKYAESERDL